MQSLVRRTILASAMVLALAACDDDDSPTATTAPGTSQVRVAHLSPDAGLVDVWVDGNLVLEDVGFKAVSGYLELDAGDHQVMVVAANTTTPAVIDATVTLADGVAYTVAATGTVANIAPAVFEDDLEPTSGQSELRLVHASPDAPAVDLTLLDGTALFSNVAFGEAGARATVDAGAYSLQVRAAGTSTVVLSFADVPVESGANYTVFAVGELGDGSLDAIVAVDSPGATSTVVDLDPAMAELRVAHLVPGAPNVDVWLDGAQALSNVPFEAFSGYLPVSAITHTVRVVVTGTTTDVIPETALTFDPNTASTVAATGLPASVQPLVLTDTREAAAAGNAWVRFVHTSPDAPEVDIVVTEGPTLFAGYAFRESSDYAQVAAGSYDLEVRLASTPPGQGTLVKTFPGVTFSGATTYSVFATDEAASLDAQAVQDND